MISIDKDLIFNKLSKVHTIVNTESNNSDNKNNKKSESYFIYKL